MRLQHLSSNTNVVSSLRSLPYYLIVVAAFSPFAQFLLYWSTYIGIFFFLVFTGPQTFDSLFSENATQIKWALSNLSRHVLALFTLARLLYCGHHCAYVLQSKSDKVIIEWRFWFYEPLLDFGLHLPRLWILNLISIEHVLLCFNKKPSVRLW